MSVACGNNSAGMARRRGGLPWPEDMPWPHGSRPAAMCRMASYPMMLTGKVFWCPAAVNPALVGME